MEHEANLEPDDDGRGWPVMGRDIDALQETIRDEIRLGVRAVVAAILYHSEDDYDVANVLEDLYPDEPAEDKP